ncbi:hypothetical protein [Sphingobacterium griseoflavum]|nr:hypothetical protein [Sphingobacterium griseoflavum]
MPRINTLGQDFSTVFDANMRHLPQNILINNIKYVKVPCESPRFETNYRISCSLNKTLGMRTRTILFLFMLTLSACKSEDRSQERASSTIRQLVLLRTEGLALAEFVEAKSQDSDVIQMGKQLKSYYQQTHPEFLNACAGNKLDLDDSDFDSLWTSISDRFQKSNQSIENTCLYLCEENIKASINLYEEIIQQHEFEEISYFSFIALPDLYNQQEYLNNLRSNMRFQQAQIQL